MNKQPFTTAASVLKELCVHQGNSLILQVAFEGNFSQFRFAVIECCIRTMYSCCYDVLKLNHTAAIDTNFTINKRIKYI